MRIRCKLTYKGACAAEIAELDRQYARAHPEEKLDTPQIDIDLPALPPEGAVVWLPLDNPDTYSGLFYVVSYQFSPKWDYALMLVHPEEPVGCAQLVAEAGWKYMWQMK
ncbi:MAG: hypothetical protein IT410_02170 [Candidatus Doudnabacteria bacterium]|nr:hypothetical protein [Candidatus Doudnabacteria bacterium]